MKPSPLKRGQPLRYRSKKREREAAERTIEREFVFARDGYRCRFAGVEGFGPCFGRLTPHHVKRAGQGGAYDRDNLIAACAHHNDALESDADLAALAESMGLVKRSWQD